MCEEKLQVKDIRYSFQVLPSIDKKCILYKTELLYYFDIT